MTDWQAELPPVVAAGDPDHAGIHNKLRAVDIELRDAVDATDLTAGGSITGTLGIAATSGAPAASGLPAGYGTSDTATGLTIASSRPSDDVVGGTDGTGRINLYSYQRANVNSFGEVVRAFAMHKDSKQMLAWYAPSSGYDNTTREPSGSTWKPVTWIGSHWESNGHTGNHKHWEIEIPDSTGALQGRFEILFGNQANETIGLDKTNTLTNLTDFTVRCHGTDSGGGDIQQVLRLSGAAGYEKAIDFSNDTESVNRRFKLRVTSEAESGGNAGSNFHIVRYDDTGTLVDQPITITRANGLVTIGGSSGTSAGLLIARNSGVALTITPLATGGQAVLVTGTDTTAAAYQGNVSGDTINRFRVFVDGKHEWGSGSSTRDTNLYRSAADTLKTDDSFTVGASGSNTTFTKNGNSVSDSFSVGSTCVAQVIRSSTSSQAFTSRVSGDTQPRLNIDSSGVINFGPGASATDVNLYRSAADTLKTDDKFITVSGLGVGNSAAATTLGSVTRKMEVFDASGTSLGFVPIYDSIT